MHADRLKNREQKYTLPRLRSPGRNTILSFPVVAYINYEIIKAIPLPVYDRQGELILFETTYPLFAINKENYNYLILSEAELKDCVRGDGQYTCAEDYPIYFLSANAPCKVQSFARSSEYYNNCEKRRVRANSTIWLPLSKPQAWLYSAPRKQEITIASDGQKEVIVEIERTGRVILNGNCQLVTSELIIKIKKKMKMREVTTYLPEFNVSRVGAMETYSPAVNRAMKLRPMVNDPKDLVAISSEIGELDKQLGVNEGYIFANKYIAYPMGSDVIVIMVVIIIGLMYCVKKKCINKNQEQ